MKEEIRRQTAKPVNYDSRGSEFRISPLTITVPKPIIGDLGPILSDGGQLVYRSKEMQAVVDVIRMHVFFGYDILIAGETGTGKEPIARFIHDLSERPGPFVKVDCTAIPEGLFESEIFGHEKGSFTGAVGQKKGKMELAAGGTLYFDEFGDLSWAAQRKLLCVLQERKMERLGSAKRISIDVLIVAATNRDLGAMIGRGEFRDDLAHRFDRRVELPPLRERLDDILLLANYFLQEIIRIKKISIVFVLSGEAEDLLLHYDYPGNVRELQKIMRDSVAETLLPFLTNETEIVVPSQRLMITGDTIERVICSLQWKRRSAGDHIGSREKSSERESWGQLNARHQHEKRQYLTAALRGHGWNIAATAREIGMSRQALRGQMSRVGIAEVES